jgi:hypothetical protein
MLMAQAVLLAIADSVAALHAEDKVTCYCCCRCLIHTLMRRLAYSLVVSSALGISYSGVMAV